MKKEFKSDKYNITRFKGLGEMPADQLKETTMDQNKRNLILINSEKAKKDMKNTESLFETLMRKQAELRFKFIQNNANFIKNLDESSLGASNFYINLLGYLQDITQSIEYVSKVSHKHINNNHSKLTLNQIRDLLDIQKVISEMFESIASAFANKSFGDIKSILKDKNKNDWSFRG